MKTLRIGVIGCGHWGPNHIRVFSQIKNATVVAAADQDDKRLAAILETFPHLRVFRNHKDMLREAVSDAVVIATPTKTHFSLVRDSLNAGKHVLCEKPLCIHPRDGKELTALAKDTNRVLMVGHIFLFNPGIQKVKEFIDLGEIGTVRYLAAVRTNLGPVRTDVNAAYDLASHDIAVFNWLLGAVPIDVQAMGAAFLQPALEDVVVITLRYPKNVLASIQCSWLDPKKVRHLTVVGSKRMITWDDLALSNPVAVYEKTVEMSREVTDYGEFLRLSTLDGDVRLPRIKTEEPLRVQATSFALAALEGRTQPCDGPFALGVVETLARVSKALSRSSCKSR